MESLYLISFGEIALKGGNRPFFERILMQRIKQALRPYDENVRLQKTHGRIYCFTKAPREKVINALKKVFGIVYISPVLSCENDLEQIKRAALEVVKGQKFEGKTFKVETRRPNKSFPLKSPEVSREVGAYILSNLGNLKVDVHNPQIRVDIEIREKAFVYCERVPGPGGLPLGCNGKAVLLLSGGIDSPVAAYMLMKRGVEIEPVYFHSFPFTSDRAKEKVIELCRVLAGYSGQMRLHVVNFTEVLKQISKNTPDEFLTIIMRRMMIRIAQEIAENVGAKALVTGESLGQVASQTMEALVATNEVATMPIFRPLIGCDKIEIMDIAKKIGTYDISIEPYADCCTVFVPQHPKTRPNLLSVQKAESGVDIKKLTEIGLTDIEIIDVQP
ncbi:putative tRNA sulfurtransferase [Tepidanaerobacter acetatoxydans Re1]|uniref:Probable tRNA sulfurtransferase n=1 Tax=Tepidanaerobacter acetatoxydans (strain DSM 21804 / JCM 16047 / Re1) TaxID=1209989 RepID=F4LWE0_TEPAE|nr:tRNA uracil 4-sulfurtransferase ThiI [Tepidanaerobacter acetatoxydans]AEE91738.1 tRNA sulfurtransferase [Tepidanaerobacter acetatoxydans Re1]CCP26506.1 putative tRNA sulfurtransferase [Tepidanaerobacter acetatoxydans Re1]